MVTSKRKRSVRIVRNNNNNNKKNKNNKIIRAERVGNNRIPSSVLDVLIHPDATPLHQIPPQSKEEAVLSKVENLLGKGHYGTAIREAKGLKIQRSSALSAHYEFLLQEKISRAYIGIADRYFIRGDTENAKKFFTQAIKPDTATTSNEVIRTISALAERTFDKLLTQRQELMDSLVNVVKDESYAGWSEKKNSLVTETIIDTDAVRQAISPDFTIEDDGLLDDAAPISPRPGWVDPIPPETEFIDFASVTPASVFKADTIKSVDVDVSIQDGNGRVRASVAMPIISNVLTAKSRLLAITTGLTPTGQAQGTVPIFQYEYLRDKAKEIIAHIKDIDSRTLPIQFKLDDFAEIVSAVRRPLLEKKAELEAVNHNIYELTETLSALAQLEKEMSNVVILLDTAQDECGCDWWCYVAAGLVIVTGILTGISYGFILYAIFGSELVAAIGGTALAALGVFAAQEITCQNIGEIGSAARTALSAMRKGIDETKSELNYQLAARDILIANINTLIANLQEISTSNQSRVLNAITLNAIQTQYNSIRQSLLSRAQAVAKLAEDAFNFQQDSNVHLIRGTYFDEDKKGYTAAESLLRDLDGLDFIDINGRKQKVMQLSNVVSLRKHYPVSFPSIWAAGRARFMTTMRDFDRWFPGTYMQRIKEVRVEVLVEDKPVPARGYISNNGVSFVRFSDTGKIRRREDNPDIFNESDADVAKLGFKRLQRRRHIDTMAFPDFESYLHKERMRKVQDKERNYFENIGPESTWLIELLPDQPFDFSKITDVRVYFQYEALFDENLKNVLQKKRYTDRRESASLSIKKLVESNSGEVAVDFSNTVTLTTSRALFESPIIDKKIDNVGFLVLPKRGTTLNGVARLEVSFQGATPPIQIETDNNGIVATAPEHPAGTVGLADLEALTHGKSVDGKWTVRIVQLPSGVDADVIEDIFLLLNYEYSL